MEILITRTLLLRLILVVLQLFLQLIFIMVNDLLSPIRLGSLPEAPNTIINPIDVGDDLGVDVHAHAHDDPIGVEGD